MRQPTASPSQPAAGHPALTATPAETQRWVAERAISGFLDTTESLLVVLDTDGRVAMLNRKARDIFGFDADQGVGFDWFERCVPASSRAHVRSAFDALLKGTGEGYATLRSPVQVSGGEERLIAWNNSLVRDDDGGVIGTISSGTDVTDMFHAEAALESSQRQLTEMKDALDQASIVGITDVKGKITYVNQKFCEISGYSEAELLGQDHRLLNTGHHPKEFIRELWRTIMSGDVWRGEILNRRKDNELYWVDTTIVPFLDETGRPYQYVSIRTDITEHKNAEKTLRERTAMARLGEMATVVAHEVKNPLAGIGGALQVIVRRMPEDGPERAIIGDILKRIELLNDTMEDLLDYARPRTLRIAQVNLEDLLSSVRDQVRADPRFADVDIVVDVQSTIAAHGRHDPLVAPMDARHVSAALLNLAINAAQALNAGGHVVLGARCHRDDLVITVVDDGPGVPAALKDRIFEPFFTTRHQGTGLGLAIVRQTAERHGGMVRLTCPPSGGTTVTFSVPLSCED